MNCMSRLGNLCTDSVLCTPGSALVWTSGLALREQRAESRNDGVGEGAREHRTYIPILGHTGRN